MKLFSKKTKGETIAETLIALTIIGIGMTFTGMLLSNSLRNITTSKNRVIAVNIAREGIEAVRSIRDGNWLRYSSKMRKCWNHMPQNPDADGNDLCDGTNIILPDSNDATGGQQNYIIYKDTGQRWRLAPHKEDPIAGVDNSNLSLVDIDMLVDTNYDTDPENDADIYNHTEVGGSLTKALGDNPVSTIFKRYIILSYLDNDGNEIVDNVDSSHNRLRVKSVVTWTNTVGEKCPPERPRCYFTVELETQLTDYLGRNNLTN
jgi:type II secretory pathway pseudopilin PulG